MECNLTVGLVTVHHILAELLEEVHDLSAIFVLVVDGPGGFDAIVPVLFEFNGRPA